RDIWDADERNFRVPRPINRTFLVGVHEYAEDAIGFVNVVAAGGVTRGHIGFAVGVETFLIDQGLRVERPSQPACCQNEGASRNNLAGRPIRTEDTRET